MPAWGEPDRFLISRYPGLTDKEIGGREGQEIEQNNKVYSVFAFKREGNDFMSQKSTKEQKEFVRRQIVNSEIPRDSLPCHKKFDELFREYIPKAVRN